MPCQQGPDSNGCQKPDFCIPMKGPMGNDGTECPAVCPKNCNEDEITCSDGISENGCKSPDFCLPNTIQGKAGTDCPAVCPKICGPDEMLCDGGMDSQGCSLENFCIPEEGMLYSLGYKVHLKISPSMKNKPR